MGTEWLAKIVTPPSNASLIEKRIIHSLNTVVGQMSPWEPQSDLRKFQATPAGDWMTFEKECFTVLKRSIDIAAQTAGIYDPTIATAVDLLGFGPSDGQDNARDSDIVRSALKRCDYRQIALEPQTRKVRQPGDMAIDLCSIAKGYAVDLIASNLEALEITDYFIEIGGEARGSGCKPDGEPWWCSLALPPETEGSDLPETLCAACGVCIATSGNYLRYRVKDGQITGHLVSPVDTPTSEQRLLSVSVFANNCMDADAFASALYLMGPKDGPAFANRQNIAALFRVAQGNRFFEIESQSIALRFE